VTSHIEASGSNLSDFRVATIEFATICDFRSI
jgi:hypothetical protein